MKLLLHTQFVDARTSGPGRITEAIVCGKSGPEALCARQFIDCTGRSRRRPRRGIRHRPRGRPDDGLQLPMSIHCFVRHVEGKDAGPTVPDGFFPGIREKKDLPMVSLWPNGPRGNSLKIKIPMFDAADTESLTAAEIQGRPPGHGGL